jgi:hypothetical protein
MLDSYDEHKLGSLLPKHLVEDRYITISFHMLIEI